MECMNKILLFVGKYFLRILTILFLVLTVNFSSTPCLFCFYFFEPRYTIILFKMRSALEMKCDCFKKQLKTR